MKRTIMRHIRFFVANCANGKSLTKAQKILAITIATLALASAGGWAKEQPVEASPGLQLGHRAETYTYGMQTLSAGQIVRLSVVNPMLSTPPEPVQNGEIVPCIRVTLGFDIYGQAPTDTPSPYDGEIGPPDPVRLSLLRRVERVVLLEAGQGATFDYAGAAGEMVSPITVVSGEINPPEPVRAGEANRPEPVRASLITSLEVRQNGATVFLLPGTTRGFNPQPDPPRVR